MSFYKNNCTKFEHYCVSKHQNDNPGVISYHWSNIPEELLFHHKFI